MEKPLVKEEVRQFYNQIGWKMESDGFYQNARYEDLRPVSREYIHRCHLRVNRFLSPAGEYLLDAGSGPVQYPEYLTYSENYRLRVCLDISIVALKEARKRLGARGLYVVADVANLPFKADVFDGLVSLHTLHHIPLADNAKAYLDFIRVLQPGKAGVVVNGWTHSVLMQRSQWLITLMERIGGRMAKRRNKVETDDVPEQHKPKKSGPTGTFIQKLDVEWLREHLSGKMHYEIWVWRSVNVRFLRAVIHRQLAGKQLLKILYGLEERFPNYFGEKGQYPLIVIRK